MLFSGVLVFAVRFLGSPGWGRAVWLGVLCGILTLVRPVAQAMILCIVIPFVVSGLEVWRRRLALSAVVLGGYLAVLTPWFLVNQHEYGFSGIATGRGLGLFTRVFEIDRLPPPQATAFPDVRLYHAASQHRRAGIANLVLVDLTDRSKYSTFQAD